MEMPLEFFKKAQKSPCSHKGSLTNKLPEWVDPSLIKEGQAFIQSNFFGIFFAHFVSLVILLCYTPVRMVLLKTDKSYPISKSRQRYLSTLLHIKLWYEGDLLSPSSRACNDVKKICCMHSRSAMKARLQNHVEEKVLESNPQDKRMLQNLIADCNSTPQGNLNNNESPFKWANDNPINQLDMIVTQFCFMGFIYLCPGKFGIHFDAENPRNGHRGMQGLIHVWAVLGYLLGIDNEFNLCLEKNQNKIQDILTIILIPELLNATGTPNTVQLWDALVSGIGSFVCCLKLKPVLLFLIKNTLELHEGPLVSSKLFRSMTYYEIFCYTLMYHCIFFWMKLRVIGKFLNQVLHLGIFLARFRFNVRV